jgi:hypothetical protein
VGVKIAYYSVGIAALPSARNVTTYLNRDLVKSWILGIPEVAVMHNDGAMERLSEEIAATSENSQIWP